MGKILYNELNLRWKGVVTAHVVLLVFIIGLAVACKSDYQRVAPVMAGMPNELPNSIRSPRGVTVYNEISTDAETLQLIDEGIASAISRGFRPDARFTPSDAPTKWKRYRNHNEYRVLLMPTSQFSITDPYVGCPILLTYSGYVAGIVSGFTPDQNGQMRDVFALIIVPRLNQRTEPCKQLFRDAVANEAEHWITANDNNVWAAFTGEFDVHPIFP